MLASDEVTQKEGEKKWESAVQIFSKTYLNSPTRTHSHFLIISNLAYASTWSLKYRKKKKERKREREQMQ